MAKSRCGPGCQGQAELPLAQVQVDSCSLIWAPWLFSLVLEDTEPVPDGWLPWDGTGEFTDPG